MRSVCDAIGRLASSIQSFVSPLDAPGVLRRMYHSNRYQVPGVRTNFFPTFWNLFTLVNVFAVSR